eukprot:augustus_masked-scaffold_52-processed-gene-1.14-mRNA-1 protein AED:0.42 eAED:0.42 QI:0/-1/0/1/-1/1/1/0/371
MGAILGTKNEEHDAVEKQLAAAYKEEVAKVKILLLGAGNAGKSTILKQFKVLHTEEKLGDAAKFKPIVSSNIYTAMTQLIEDMQNLQSLKHIISKDLIQTVTNLKAFVSEGNATTGDVIWHHCPNSGTLVLDRLKEVFWADVTQEVLTERFSELNRFEIPVQYFFREENYNRIKQEDYIPTEEDYLNCRVRTTGIVSINFTLDRSKCTLIDVGGQRTERKKWISHFDNVTAVLFLVSLADYDRTLLEDGKTNRMQEALSVFKEIVEGPYFCDINMILFLNKKDLFKEKMASTRSKDLSTCFHDWPGGKDYKNAVKFISDKFQKIYYENRDPEKMQLYVYTTQATNSANVKAVVDTCKSILLKSSLRETGFM